MRAERRTGNVLADRKDLLRFLHAVLGKEGVAVIDATAEALWSRAGLEAELAHDAELDIDGIYTLHLLDDSPEELGREGGRSGYWLHGHGLADMGFWDFDILDPSPDLFGHARDLLRVLAFAVVEERLVPGKEPVSLIAGAPVRAVPVREFLRDAPQTDHRQYRAGVDSEHIDGHAVICEVEPRSRLQRFFRGSWPLPSRFLSGPMPDRVMLLFSTSATQLMARRARGAFDVFREATREFAEFEFPALLKLRYRIDGGGEDDREHLWFQVHEVHDDSVDATLLNRRSTSPG